jgi:Acetyltransferase (GNAT) domain
LRQIGGAYFLLIKFTYIEKFGLQADEDLEKWEDFLAPYVVVENSRKFREAVILHGLHEDSGSFPLNFRGIRDDQGNLQSAAVILDQTEQLSNHILIQWLASAPWNRSGTDARKRTGFGELMLKQIVKESKAKGYGGRIAATSSPDAKKFYLKFGFTPDERREGKMVFTPTAASRFLNS